MHKANWISWDKYATLILIALILTLGSSNAFGKPSNLTLAKDGKTQYTIVIGNDATDGEKFAAEDLAKHLKLITDADFPIKNENEAGNSSLIFVGSSKLLFTRKSISQSDLAKFGEEELLVRTSGKDLILVGGRPRGSLYAVYSFLEDDLGCHWWTPIATTTPKKPTLTLSSINRRDAPFMEYRLPAFSGYSTDAIYAIRNRISAMQDNPSEVQNWPGGMFKWANRYCHSFAYLAPAEKLMAEHPNWYSKGTQPDKFQWTGQFCLTNPELEDYVVNQLRDTFRANPKSQIASVSQNDNQNPCKCERCEALAKTMGQSGLMVSFLNRIAAKLKPEFPDKILHTFAYQYTQQPPLDKSIRVDDNVVIQLTTEGVNHAQPLRDTKLKDILEQWSKIAKRVYIWDYETNFLYHQAPIPNLLSLGPNFNWFAENHVRGMLIQGGHRIAGEFSDLRGWMAAKLMWNPKQNAQPLMDTFLKGYYQEAAPYIKEYIDLLQQRTGKELWDMYVYIMEMPSLDWRLMLDSQAVFDKAEESVKDKPEVLTRVRSARMQVDYMMILRGDEYLREAKNAGETWPAQHSPEKRIRAFFANAEETGFAAECVKYDQVKLSPMGERGGTWADLREKSIMLLVPETMKMRFSVFAAAAGNACELMKLEQAERYLKYLQSCIKTAEINVRETPIDIVCPKMTNHSTGKFEDWDAISEAGNIASKSVDTPDLSGSFKLGWDSDYLYILTAVQDNALVPDCKKYWTADGIELYLNMLDDQGFPQADGTPTSAYGPDDFHFGISAEGCIYDYDSTSVGNPLGLGKVAGMLTDYKKTDTGYLLETAIPWKSLFLRKAENDYTFGFTIAIDDLDEPGEPLKHHLLWKGSTAYINTQGWGRVQLQNEGVTK